MTGWFSGQMGLAWTKGKCERPLSGFIEDWINVNKNFVFWGKIKTHLTQSYGLF